MAPTRKVIYLSPFFNFFRSLELKLESLKAGKGIYIQVDYDSSQTESPVHLPKTEVTESSVKETSKDGLSAGSFTLDSCTNWSTGNQIPVAVSPETGTKPEVSENCEPNKVLSIKNLSETCIVQGGTMRKRRGKRKRKDCSREVKEGSIGESDNLGSANAITASLSKETSTGECGQTVRSSSIDGHTNDLIGIFNSVAENKHALCFRRRLDSQVITMSPPLSIYTCIAMEEYYLYYGINSFWNKP